VEQQTRSAGLKSLTKQELPTVAVTQTIRDDTLGRSDEVDAPTPLFFLTRHQEPASIAP
jgi:hypothetical protein